MGKHKEKKAQRKHDDDNDNNEEVVVPSSVVEKKEKKRSKEERKSKKRKRKERKDDEEPPVAPEQRQAKEEVDDDDDQVNERKRKKDKKKKKKQDLQQEESTTTANKDKKKKKKKRKKEQEPASDDSSASSATMEDAANKPTRIVASSALDFYDSKVKETKLAQTTQTNISLLLFYQYVEPPWDESTYDKMLKELQKLGKRLNLTGRMRVAKEGLNCTLTASHDSIMEYCQTLQTLRPNDFKKTEFKVTQDLPQPQKFRELKVLAVAELVNYGLEGTKAPPIQQYHGTHLEPKDYHMKIAQDNTVIIDVRNHYEANIGRFVPPTSSVSDSQSQTASTTNEPPKWLDPKMRKSTEFPAWLDRPETKEQMKGKQVLMYCTGMLLLWLLHILI